MSWLWAASGPLVEPSSRSGVTDWDGCSHVPPASCTSCDGTRAETSEYWRSTPVERRAFNRDMARWDARRAAWAATDLTTAEEATQ